MLFAPRRCFVCRRILRRDEEILCTACLSDIQQTGIVGEPDNVVERLFWGVTPVERAASWLKYTSGSNVGEMIHALKYAGMIRIGHLLGRAMGRAMYHHGFFDGVDLIVPVPLHKRKEDERDEKHLSFEEAFADVEANVKEEKSKAAYLAWIARLRAETYVKVF